MALTTITKLKTALGISGSGEDTQLTQFLGQASWTIRAYVGMYLGGQITSASVANPSVITCPGHGLETGDSIVIAHSGTTPTIDGARTVTRVDDDSFSVPVNVTGAGTAGLGTFARTYTEYYDGTGKRDFQLRQRPVQSIASLYLDPSAAYGEATDAFAAATLLTAGTDYNLARDANPYPEKSRSGWVVKIGGVWPRPGEGVSGLLGSYPGSSNGSIKVTYTAGFVTIPADLVLAVCQLVAEMRRTSSSGGVMQSESFYGYSYSLADASTQVESLSSVKSILNRYKPIAI